ncbi:MAG: hypothetical protein FWC89_13965 [Defluviitaleaceae bacterium]|nr:hypothetical protein [Defluviitaleaceae bacterium]
MSKSVTLNQNQEFSGRQEISDLLGGDVRKGIAPSSKADVILLFRNEDEIYADYFYPNGTYENFMYTGIGREGHQDSLKNNMYNLNIDVLSHRSNGDSLLVFEKRKPKYYFVGEYRLTETHQNIQPDKNNNLRRVFVFHLELISTTINLKLL